MIKTILFTVVSAFDFVIGYCNFLIFSKTPKSSHRSMRRLFRITNGRSNDLVSNLISLVHPPKSSLQKSQTSALGALTHNEIDLIVSNIEANGFHVFENKLEQIQIDALLEFAETKPCEALLESNGDKLKFEYSQDIQPYRKSKKSVKYNFRPIDILSEKTIQKLIVDPTILYIAERYLRCKPILDLVAMWWSQPSPRPSSAAAQLYHFDMDRIKFIKFFFYLTDVTDANGPHCYVRGTCKRKPKALLKDGRFLDEEMDMHFEKNDFVEILGEQGTIIAVDTRGFHKGKQLDVGERLILQFEFANSMFGADYEKIDFKETPECFVRALEQNKRLFGLLD